jgi:hypothetical protein
VIANIIGVITNAVNQLEKSHDKRFSDRTREKSLAIRDRGDSSQTIRNSASARSNQLLETRHTGIASEGFIMKPELEETR